jgi:ABC-type sulfate/molybdate transport systems ATPase subunit
VSGDRAEASRLHVRIVKRLPGFALEADWHAGDGVVALFGPSGAGKTLTLQCLAGLVRPDSGRIVVDGTVFFDGADGIDVATQKRRLGYVFQRYALFPHLSVADNVGYGLHGRSRAERRRRTGLVLERLGLGALADRRPRELSGGQQQRVALGRALAVDPDLLLLDEPLSALDAPLRRQLRQELMAIVREWGKATVLVTHDLAEAFQLADRVVVYEGGRVVQQAPKTELLSAPASERVARLMGVRNILIGTVLNAGSGELPESLVSPRAGGAAVLLHPSRVRAAHPQGPGARRRPAPHEPHGRACHLGGGLRDHVDAVLSPRRGGGAGPGRARPRDRGAPDGLRDPRGRPRSALAAVDPPRLHPRPPVVMGPVLELVGVRVAFGERPVLDVPALEVRHGEILAVIGPNGAGKSTLLGVVSTLVRPTAGEVRYGGWTARQLGDPLRGRIGMLGHDLFLYGDLTARENLEFFGKLYELDRLGDRVQAALASARLTERAGDRVSGFSRGLRQRLALERALLHGPRLVLLDEPFTGLDDESTALLSERLRKLRADGAIVVMATHDFECADDLVDRMICLREGRMREVAPDGTGLRARYRRAMGEAWS